MTLDNQTNLQPTDHDEVLREGTARALARADAREAASKNQDDRDAQPKLYDEPKPERPFVIDPDTGRRVYLDAEGADGDQPEPELVAPTALPPAPEPTYELSVPETLTSSQREAATAYGDDVAVLATEAGIPPSEAQELFNIGLDLAVHFTDNNGEEPNLANQGECAAFMAHRWGAEGAKELQDLAAKAVARLGPRVRAWLDTKNDIGEQLGNSPAIVYALAAYQRGLTRMTPAQAERELKTLRATKEYQTGSKRHTDLAAILGRRAFPNADGGPKPRQAMQYAPSKEETLQAELNQLRLDPAYFDKSRPNHKSLVARVQTLTRQLYGE